MLTSGAARGALHLHEALLGHGVDSRVLSSFSPAESSPFRNTIHAASWTGVPKIEARVRSRLEAQYLNTRYPRRQRHIFSIGAIGAPIWRHPWILRSDVVHLHWINAGLVRLQSLRRLKKPIVWTVRDMWPSTGGCHVAMDCTAYTSGCGACPQLRSTRQNDLTKRQVRKKRQLYRQLNVTFVGMSPWGADVLRSSRAVPDRMSIRVIPNAIDTKRFVPHDKAQARAKYGIAKHETVVLLGAHNVSEPWKGFSLAAKAVRGLPKQVLVVLFGTNSERLAASMKHRAIGVGYVATPNELADLYSMADVFVAPSVQEQFGKTLVESLACGTPVAAFDATGPQLIVQHRRSGYLARPFSSDSLREGIEWIVADKERWGALSAFARQDVVARFERTTMALEYIDLYHEVSV